MSKKQIEYILKLIPIFIFLFLICNYIFNVGYFTLLSIKFLSLLNIRDYYEGTAPLITLSFITIFSIFNFLMCTESIRLFPKYLSYLFNAIFIVPIRILWCRLVNIYYFIFYRRQYKNNYKLKKKWLKTQKDLFLLRKDNNKYKIKFIKYFKIFIYPLFVVLLPLYVIFFFVYKSSVILFWTIITIYFIYVIIVLFCENIGKISFSIFMLVIFIYFFGMCTFLRDFKYSGTYVIVNGSKQLLIRPLSKGVISKKENHIIFTQWDSVNEIFKDVESKNTN